MNNSSHDCYTELNWLRIDKSTAWSRRKGNQQWTYPYINLSYT